MEKIKAMAPILLDGLRWHQANAFNWKICLREKYLRVWLSHQSVGLIKSRERHEVKKDIQQNYECGYSYIYLKQLDKLVFQRAALPNEPLASSKADYDGMNIKVTLSSPIPIGKNRLIQLLSIQGVQSPFVTKDDKKKGSTENNKL